MPRTFLPAAALATLGLGLLSSPGTAQAETYCVSAPECSGTALPFQSALDAAGKTAADDTVVVGAGDLPGSFAYLPVADDAGDLEIRGAGLGTTRFTGLPGMTALTVAADKAGNPTTVKQLSFVLRPGAQNRTTGAKGFRTTFDTVSVQPETPGQHAEMVGIDVRGGTLRDVVVDLDEATKDKPVIGVLTADAEATIERSRIAGARALVAQAPTTVLRTVLTGDGGAGVAPTVVAEGTTLKIASSVVEHAAGQALGGGSVDDKRADVRLENATVVGHHGSSFIACGKGLDVHAFSTLLHGQDATTMAAGQPECTLEAGWSRLPVGPSSGDGFTFTSRGGNVDHPAAFADPSNGDYRLRAVSELVDRGRPGPLGADDVATADLDGEARVQDGDGDGDVRRDIGAFERPTAVKTQPVPTPTPPAGGGTAPADRTAPKLSKVSFTSKQTLRFRLTEAARVKVTLQVKRRGKYVGVGSSSFDAKSGAGRRSLAKKLPKRSRGKAYRLRIVATDQAGNRSGARSHKL